MINNQNIGVLSEKVARLESDVKTLALPPVETTDEGKALVVNSSGAWEAAIIDGDDVPYSEGVSVSDELTKLNSVTTVLSIAADTYTSWSDALAALYVEFAKLTNTEKLKSVVVRADNIVYHLSSAFGDYYCAYKSGVSDMDHQMVSLSSGLFVSVKTLATGNTVTDNSSATQGQKIELLIIN